MGNQQSKQETSEKAIVDGLTSLRVQDAHVSASSAPEKELRLVREPEGLPVQLTEAWQSNLLSDPKNKLALTALSTANPRDVLTSRATVQADQQVFNVRIPFEGGPITNQRSSGRCWLFASTNVFRVALMKRYGLDAFELSQAYLFFWDKFEKSNWFLEQIIDTAGEDLDGRLVQTLLGDIASDGGQWDMVYNLVTKYGLVPQTLFPDSWTAQNSSVVNSIVKTKLREYALILREMINGQSGKTYDSAADLAKALSSEKQRMMREILLVLTVTMGKPPNPDEEFTWQYIDKAGKAHELVTTPTMFAKDIYSPEFRVSTAIIEGMVSLVNDPRHEYLSLMTVDRLGNIVGGRGITYVNVAMDTLKSTCIAMLKAGLPVFFGSDVGKFSNSSSGIMDLDLIDYPLGFNVSLLNMDKAARLRTGESAMTHAMVLTAVHVDEKTGKSVRWRVQNSWGETAGDKGWFVMSDAWMDEFCYQAVVDPKFLSKEVRDVTKQEPTVLPLWDPMGSLA